MVSKEPIEKILYPTVAKEWESEILRVRCPECGEKKFYRFVHSDNHDWMCFDWNCDYVLKSTEGSKIEPCFKKSCVHFEDLLFPCYDCIDSIGCQKPWHPSFYEEKK